VSKFGLVLAVTVPGGDIVVGNWIRCAVAGADHRGTSNINRKNGNRPIRDTILLPNFGRFVPIYKEKRWNRNPLGSGVFYREKT
jgi:hypothetical protein